MTELSYTKILTFSEEGGEEGSVISNEGDGNEEEHDDDNVNEEAGK